MYVTDFRAKRQKKTNKHSIFTVTVVLLSGIVTNSFQVAGKRDVDQEVEAQQWIETVIGEKFPAGKRIIIIIIIRYADVIIVVISGRTYSI